MNMRALLGPIAVAALAVPMLLTSNAAAQHHQEDGARFRGGVALEGGPFVLAGCCALGSVGVAGHLGAQINNNWGVYAIPSFDIAFGKGSGVNLGAAVVADYTLNDMFSFGAGLDSGAFLTLGNSTASAGAVYGGRAR